VSGGACYDAAHRGPDGLHMTAAGHQVVAARLFPVIRRMLAPATAHASARRHAPKPTPRSLKRPLPACPSSRNGQCHVRWCSNLPCLQLLALNLSIPSTLLARADEVIE
jgi:hypothetical protein